MTPARLGDTAPHSTPPAASPRPAPVLIPRCDETILKALAAGAKGYVENGVNQILNSTQFQQL